MTGMSIQATDLSVHFGDIAAVDRVSFNLNANGIYGLLGRNGSGKTTILSVLAGLRAPTSGELLVDGEVPFENERIMEHTAIIRESGDVIGTESVATNLSYFQAARPTWDPAYADKLIDTFRLDPKKKLCKLSRGQRSAFGAVVGLASRAPLTIFDEVYLGMDAPTRELFYDQLLADFIEHPRTILMASHLISEVEQLLESVVILDNGRVLLADDTDSLRGKATTLTGPTSAIDQITCDLNIIARRELGRTSQITVYADLDEDALRCARSSGLEPGPVPLQDLFIHLTKEEAS